MVFTCLALSARADVDWPTLTFSQATSNIFHAPTGILHAGDNSQRLFILEQTGRVWAVIGSNVLAQPFLNITNRVLSSDSEQGLLGLAFPPGYATNSHFYADYTRNPDGATVISRFGLTVNSNIANAASEQVLLVITQAFTYHNGGQLAFGPDGYLYIGKGDGGAEGDPDNHGQDPGLLLGKILRIKVEGVSTYGVPTNNPFVGIPGYAPEIWALGVRNPWRFSFDRLTGDLYLGDVGQNLFEEVDFQPAGAPGGQNYGWRIMEGATNYNVPPGFTNFSALTSPVAWYDHRALPADFNGAVIGGYVYRGPSEPRMDGMYFFGDYMAGWIWGMKRDGTNWQNVALVNPGPPPPFPIRMSTFGEDDQGKLYLADYSAGKIYRIQDSRQVWAPLFTPTNGIINSNTVLLSCFTTNAEIHYTTNGADPTESDPIVLPGIVTVVDGVTNKVKAFRSDLTPSSVVTAVFNFRTGTPIFSPPAGPITNNSTVSISCETPGAAIYFTTNSATPTTNSTLYSSQLILSGPVTLKGIATAAGYSNSLVATVSYAAAQVATPVFNPASGPITNGTLISMSNATPGAVIFYTLNGSTPTTNSSVYSSPISISGGTTVNARGVAPGYVDSSIRSVFYQLVQTATPLFSPASGPISNGTPITITCATPGSTIYYTVDGSTPTTNSAVYGAPVSITGANTLSAIATADAHLISAVHATFFGLYDYKYRCVVTTIAGNGQPGLVNGVRSLARFSSPLGLCIDAIGNLYVADTGNNVIRKITPDGVVSTFASLAAPIGICVDPGGNLYVTGVNSYQIWKIDPGGNVSVFAGSGISGYQNGPAATAQFLELRYLKCNLQTNLFVGDWARVRTVTNGTVGTLAGTGVNDSTGLGAYIGLDLSTSNMVYAASTSGRVFEITPAGVQTLFSGNTPGYSDGPRLVALFSDGSTDARDVAVATSGDIYVSDFRRVRRIDTSGWVSTLAGSTNQGFLNGDGRSALFNRETGLCVDTNGNIYVADTGNHCIRKISPDTAGIGIADDWQIANFGFIGIDPGGDPDHDGMSNYGEFWTGTDPNNSNSVLIINSVTLATNNLTRITWTAVPGMNYVIKYSSDFLSWNTLGSTLQATGSVISVTDPTPARQNPKRFYRVLPAGF